jgi:hypothetical protein
MRRGKAILRDDNEQGSQIIRLNEVLWLDEVDERLAEEV